ncbi:MAG: tRNA pseudouridine(55) synthase TruB, partial [Planctomycetota bacterium]|nr:tRNA pseudouridine(55) synthase TruB [Planctomycetota bacterium]
ADGVLVICIGPATRLARYVQAQPKRYRAEITLGATSSTDDCDGKIIPTPKGKPAPEDKLRDTLRRFVGKIKQVPPVHSAVHVAGRRAYKLARAGKQPQRPPRPVVIHAVELVRYEYPTLEIDVRCGSGTYIRSLARDIGTALGVGGYCSSLTRMEVGGFYISDATSLEELSPARDLISPLAALENHQKVKASPAIVNRLRNGNPVELPEGPPGEVAVINELGQLVAIATIEDDGRTLRPTKVFIS